LGHIIGSKPNKINRLQRNIHPKKMETDIFNYFVRNGLQMQHGENRRPARAPLV